VTLQTLVLQVASVLQMGRVSVPYSHSSCGMLHAVPPVGAVAGQPLTSPPLEPLPLEPLLLEPDVPLEPLLEPPSPPISVVFPLHARARTTAPTDVVRAKKVLFIGLLLTCGWPPFAVP
jgi:hypothetical protein